MTIQTDRITCKIAADWADRVGDRLRDDRDGLESWPGLEIIKESRVRTVRRGTLQVEGAAAVGIHLKTYRAVRLSDHARDALSGSRGVREFDNLVEARSRGLDCVEPIAAGRETGAAGSRSFLITASTDATALAATGGWSPTEAAAAGRALRRAHDCGLHDRDLHPGNMLVRTDRAVLCDLTSAVLANPLEADQRARALAIFCLGLDGLVLDPTAAPLLAAYGADEAIVAQAQRAAARLRQRALEAFGRRSQRACRQSEILIEGPNRNVTWSLRRDASRELHEAARTWFERSPRSEPSKQGRRGAVWLDGALAIKERSKAHAQQLYRARFWLEFAGIPAPKAVALRLHDRQGHVFSERLPWPDLATEFAALDTATRRSAATALGDALGRMHAHGLRNRDLKFENLIRDPATGTVHVVDLDGVRRRHPLESRGQARDLGRLLAAYRCAIGTNDVDRQLLSRFAKSYNRALRRLRVRPNPRLWRHTEDRANEWANAHPNTQTS